MLRTASEPGRVAAATALTLGLLLAGGTATAEGAAAAATDEVIARAGVDAPYLEAGAASRAGADASSSLAAEAAVRAEAPEILAALQQPDAQEDEAADGASQEGPIVSSEVFLGADVAALRLELLDRSLELVLSNGRVQVDGRRVGAFRTGGPLDTSFRRMLEEARDASPADLAGVLLAWNPPEGPGANRMRAALHSALRPDAPEPARAAAADPGPDTLRRLEDRIRELERELRRAEREATPARARDTLRPLRHVLGGLAGILRVVALYIVLAGLGFATVFFGRPYLEGVSDTARHATLRSGLVGVASAFLLLPAFILGIIALAISLVGIPLLLVWVFAFPLAVVLSALLGYLGVAHAAGEALAERRFYDGSWFQRANSYYYLLTGLGLLLGLYAASHFVAMAGPWLGFVRGTLAFLAVAVTSVALAIGFGAAILSRGGTRPVRPVLEPELSDVFEEETRV